MNTAEHRLHKEELRMAIEAIQPPGLISDTDRAMLAAFEGDDRGAIPLVEWQHVLNSQYTRRMKGPGGYDRACHWLWALLVNLDMGSSQHLKERAHQEEAGDPDLEEPPWWHVEEDKRLVVGNHERDVLEDYNSSIPKVRRLLPAASSGGGGTSTVVPANGEGKMPSYVVARVLYRGGVETLTEEIRRGAHPPT